jgi:hypothetical protein
VGVEAALALFVTLAAWRWMRRPEHPSPRGGEAR